MDLAVMRCKRAPRVLVLSEDECSVQRKDSRARCWLEHGRD